jgi:hypothetical protein
MAFLSRSVRVRRAAVVPALCWVLVGVLALGMAAVLVRQSLPEPEGPPVPKDLDRLTPHTLPRTLPMPPELGQGSNLYSARLAEEGGRSVLFIRTHAGGDEMMIDRATGKFLRVTPPPRDLIPAERSFEGATDQP